MYICIYVTKPACFSHGYKHENKSGVSIQEWEWQTNI